MIYDRQNLEHYKSNIGKNNEIDQKELMYCSF